MEGIQAAVWYFFREDQTKRRCRRGGWKRRFPKNRTPGCSSEKRNPRKSLVNCWIPARTETKSKLGTEIMQFGFDKGFLQADVGIEAVRCPCADLCSLCRVPQSAGSFRLISGCKANAKIHGTKTGVSAKEVERQPQVLGHEGLLATTKEATAAGIL